ncbi:MAG: hypothetical protein WBE26_15350 [Phycisphaerae bacterium]
MWYRVLMDLDTGNGIIRAGTISQLAQLSERSRNGLTEKERIAPVAPPPLSVLPGLWRYRARRLRKLGIADGLQLMEADAEALAQKLELTPNIVERLQREVTDFMVLEGG